MEEPEEEALNYAGLAFDGLLALALPVLAWRALSARDLYRAVILFSPSEFSSP